MNKNLPVVYLLHVILVMLTACTGGVGQTNGDKLKVIATTSIVADIVQQIGGEHVQVITLLPLGTDPHTFEPRPQDAAALVDARIVFANGAGLEEFLEPLLESSGASGKLVEVSNGITYLGLAGEESDIDPHTWMDPNNVLNWVVNICDSLILIDPDHSDNYQANSAIYASHLEQLDKWIRAEVDLIPLEERNLVSDHAVLGYFADEYGFNQLGTITGSFSTQASSSAQELARLEDLILNSGVKAVFVSKSGNPILAEQLVVDTGVEIIGLFYGSLSGPGRGGENYLEMMRYNVFAIVKGLR